LLSRNKIFYNGKVNIEGIDAIEEEINQMSRARTMVSFPGPTRVVTLNEVYELRTID
jgi:hypothetical protein